MGEATPVPPGVALRIAAGPFGAFGTGLADWFIGYAQISILTSAP